MRQWNTEKDKNNSVKFNDIHPVYSVRYTDPLWIDNFKGLILVENQILR